MAKLPMSYQTAARIIRSKYEKPSRVLEAAARILEMNPNPIDMKKAYDALKRLVPKIPKDSIPLYYKLFRKLKIRKEDYQEEND